MATYKEIRENDLKILNNLIAELLNRRSKTTNQTEQNQINGELNLLYLFKYELLKELTANE